MTHQKPSVDGTSGEYFFYRKSDGLHKTLMLNITLPQRCPTEFKLFMKVCLLGDILLILKCCCMSLVSSMALVLQSSTFYCLSLFAGYAEGYPQSRWQGWPLQSRRVMKHKVQLCCFPRYGTHFKHYGIRSQASSDENGSTESPPDSESETNMASAKKTKARADIQKGQVTAILTGAVAVLLGVGYLLLVQLLDTRGIILQPPPPEAFEP